jgi:hypothetical protein
MDELLHYPVPREVIPGLKAYVSSSMGRFITEVHYSHLTPLLASSRSTFLGHQKIAVSNYTGDAREYIKKLIMALGGQWTNSLSKAENTHLIAAKSVFECHSSSAE